MGPGDDDYELVPLRTEFAPVWRGYDRQQVLDYVKHVDAEMSLLALDRDAAVEYAEALVCQSDELRAANEQLQASLDRICRSPMEPAAVPERLRHMIRVANQDAEEILSRAEAKAKGSWRAAARTAAELRERYERHAAEIESGHQALESANIQLLQLTRDKADKMIEEAELSTRQLDEVSARRRKQAEDDFRLAMTARRADALKEIAAQQAAAQEAAGRQVTEAEEHADSIVRDAEHKLAELQDVRRRVAEQLLCATRLVAEANPTPGPEHGEADNARSQPKELPAFLAEPANDTRTNGAMSENGHSTRTQPR